MNFLHNSTRALALTGALLLGATGIATGVAASNGNGEGHTPVTLCHFVPAHGGSYIVITVDDDGSSGNVNLKGHMGHDDDIIPAVDGQCPTGTPDDVPPGGLD
jgi:hypothetical protein